MISDGWVGEGSKPRCPSPTVLTLIGGSFASLSLRQLRLMNIRLRVARVFPTFGCNKCPFWCCEFAYSLEASHELAGNRRSGTCKRLLLYIMRHLYTVFTVRCCCTLLQVGHAPSLKTLVLIFMDIKLIRLYERITPVDLYDFYSIEVHVHLIVPLTASWRVSWY
jgi:hypothetical protein